MNKRLCMRILMSKYCMIHVDTLQETIHRTHIWTEWQIECMNQWMNERMNDPVNDRRAWLTYENNNLKVKIISYALRPLLSLHLSSNVLFVQLFKSSKLNLIHCCKKILLSSRVCLINLVLLRSLSSTNRSCYKCQPDSIATLSVIIGWLRICLDIMMPVSECIMIMMAWADRICLTVIWLSVSLLIGHRLDSQITDRQLCHFFLKNSYIAEHIGDFYSIAVAMRTKQTTAK